MAGPVDLILMRGALGELALRPGMVLHGRVLDARTLLLEGVRLAARLPDDVVEGQRLRLRIEEAAGERLHLRIVDDPPAAHAQGANAPAPGAEPGASAYALALPGGAVARVAVQRRDGDDEAAGGSAGDPSTVVVRYDSPVLGRLDVRLEMGAAAVHVSAGDAERRVREAAGELSAALGRAAGGRPVQVTVHPREETLDVRA